LGISVRRLQKYHKSHLLLTQLAPGKLLSGQARKIARLTTSLFFYA